MQFRFSNLAVFISSRICCGGKRSMHTFVLGRT